MFKARERALLSRIVAQRQDQIVVGGREARIDLERSLEAADRLFAMPAGALSDPERVHRFAREGIKLERLPKVDNRIGNLSARSQCLSIAHQHFGVLRHGLKRLFEEVLGFLQTSLL